jgi:polyisoprenoid-binding protein YceI
MTVTATELSAYTGTWTLDPSHSEIGFTARHAVVTKVRGKFTAFEGVLNLDGENPSASAITFSAELASIDTGSADRDAHLRSADFFDVDTNKALEFVSTGVEVNAASGSGVLRGDLTIKGVTRPVEIAVDFGGLALDPFGNQRVGFEGTTSISRKDFGLTWNVALETGGFLVSDEIKISLDISAIKQA